MHVKVHFACQGRRGQRYAILLALEVQVVKSFLMCWETNFCPISARAAHALPSELSPSPFAEFLETGPLPSSQINAWRLIFTWECPILAWLPFLYLNGLIFTFCLWVFTFFYSLYLSLLLTLCLTVWLCGWPMVSFSPSFFTPLFSFYLFSLYVSHTILLLTMYWPFSSLLDQSCVLNRQSNTVSQTF